MARLHTEQFLRDQIPGLSRQGAYRLMREHPEITVRIGRKVFIDEERWREFIDAGGSSLDREKRREPDTRPAG